MRKAIDRAAPQEHEAHHGAALDWRKSMSNNVAYALLVYTGLQIFVTVHALKSGSASMLPYIALVVLVAAIIPACRAFEGRWMEISDADAADPAYSPAFRRDQMFLWALAIGLPFLLTGMFKALSALN
ncbi:hypothetical protein [Tsuneonella mangrovi]|uniref:hypothetical protein n=1 Tax=Tsuneonella mangrovi TaxID=1982042 RepID=UPI000BA1D1ED|nr:hypothetical protein [Tsuneonella mangrovi]